MKLALTLIPLALAILGTATDATAQFHVPGQEDQVCLIPPDAESPADAQGPPTFAVADSLLGDMMAAFNTLPVRTAPVPAYYFTPAVFDTYRWLGAADTLAVAMEPRLQAIRQARWLDQADMADLVARRALQQYMISRPSQVDYNIAWMPRPPRRFEAVIDPSTQQIQVREVAVDTRAATIEKPVYERTNWIHTFKSSLQFSQAYVSPNWYQGGNNNLNAIASIYWNVNLNQRFHPNLLFDNTVQYKVGFNSAPDDSLRNFSISEDLLQLNTTFGVKAVRHWYYSLTLQFKTQLLNAYTKNTRQLRSAFMSPADLNVGLGMTYNYTSPSKAFTTDLSVAPMSYNMKICTRPDRDLPHGQFDIDPGRHMANQYGSSMEMKVKWKVAYNISVLSRLFAFTDYSYFQADWENTISFDINRFLSTQVYVHARYDTTTARAADDPSWHKLQLKEILSLGFAYRFATL